MSDTRIEAKRRTVEKLLENMPSNMVEAKRYIARETSREPEPQVLQCMVRIAGNIQDNGPRREFSLSMLTLRSVADDQLALFNGEGNSQPESILEAADVLRCLEKDLERIERELAVILPAMEENDKQFLTGLHGKLVPSRERLLTAQVLARFFEFPNHPELPKNCSVEQRDGTILLHLIGLDLAAWLGANIPTEGESVISEEDRNLLWTRLGNCKIAYKHISPILASRKDTSFVKGRKPEYESINQLQRDLFSAYSRLSKILTAGKNGPEGQDTGDGAIDELNINTSIAEAEMAAEALHEENEQRRGVVDDALRGVRESRPASHRLVKHLEREERSQKRRIRIMGIICGVLVVVAIVVNLALLNPESAAVEISPEEFDSTVPVSRATAAATMMLVETEYKLWYVWNPEERKRYVQELVRQAEQKGFSSLLLSDENGRQLAFWQKFSEPQLF